VKVGQFPEISILRGTDWAGGRRARARRRNDGEFDDGLATPSVIVVQISSPISAYNSTDSEINNKGFKQYLHSR
jgi:hypothetical protein